jgi:hypothetical protein
MSLEAEQEMWEAIASQPAPAAELAWRDGSQGRECVSNAAPRRLAVCDRCGRELGTGLPSPCSRCGQQEVSVMQLHDAEYHERIEAETGASCQDPECLAVEVVDEDEPRAGGIPGDGWKPGRTVEIND